MATLVFVFLLAFAAIIALLALVVYVTKSPMSRPTHVVGVTVIFIISTIFNLLDEIMNGDDFLNSSSSYLWVVISAFIGMFWIYFNARRFIDLGWNKWWVILTIIPVLNIVISAIPFFYATRTKEQEIIKVD